MDARPDILNHNLETVRRLQKPSASAPAGRRLYVLRRAQGWPARSATGPHESRAPGRRGETRDELQEAFERLRGNDVDIHQIGQYLRPSMRHLPLERYYPPDEFAEMRPRASAGFKHVEVGAAGALELPRRDQVPGADSIAAVARHHRREGRIVSLAARDPEPTDRCRRPSRMSRPVLALALAAAMLSIAASRGPHIPRRPAPRRRPRIADRSCRVTALGIDLSNVRPPASASRRRLPGSSRK